MTGPVGIEAWVGPSVSGAAVPRTDILAAHYAAHRITGAAENDPISQWDDLSGNDRHLLQATSGQQLLYISDGIGGRPVLRADGVDDYMQADFGATISQTNTIGMVARYRSVSGILCDGIVGTARHIISESSGSWRIYAGTNLVAATAVDTNSFSAVAKFAGASSTLHVREEQIASGDAGLHSLTGLTIAAPFGASKAFAEADFAELVVWDGALSASDLSDFHHYVHHEYGRLG